MNAADGRSTGALAALAVGLALGLGGCAAPRACYCRDGPIGAAASSSYAVASPDVLAISSPSQPDLSGHIAIGPDGAIPIGADDRIRVEGLTPNEIADKLTTALQVPRSSIQIQVANYASRQLFLCGPIEGQERAVAYQGPEPVADFLMRNGGLSRDAEPRSVHVVRANVAVGRRPEVFQVDLKAILIEHDEKTNVVLQPYDQVYFGESPRAWFARCLPPWMQFGRRAEP